jgi:hypothetical protein
MRKSLAVSALSLLALGACASKGDVEAVRSEIAGLRSSLDSIDAKASRAETESQRAAADSARAAADARVAGEKAGPDLPRGPAQVVSRRPRAAGPGPSWVARRSRSRSRNAGIVPGRRPAGGPVRW